MLAKLQKLSGLHHAVYCQSRPWESWESLISVPGVLGLMLALYLERSEGRRLARATMIENQGEGSQNLSKTALLPRGMAKIHKFTRPNGHLGTRSQVWAIWKNLVWENWSLSDSPHLTKKGECTTRKQKRWGETTKGHLWHRKVWGGPPQICQRTHKSAEKFLVTCCYRRHSTAKRKLSTAPAFANWPVIHSSLPVLEKSETAKE